LTGDGVDSERVIATVEQSVEVVSGRSQLVRQRHSGLGMV
jgi:hypothetical protein